MIQLTQVTKRFGDIVAVRNVSLFVKPGEIVGFLGPNGAGKTTTMRMITGYLLPDEGKVEVGGMDVVRYPELAKRKIGYLPEDNPLYEDMTPYEYLEYGAAMRFVSKHEFKKRLWDVVDKTGIEDVLTRPIGELSKGYRQRVGLAHALIHDPEVLILDEPTSGLDPSQIVSMRELIKELSKEKTVILSTHIMQEAQHISDKIVIINKGKIVAQGTPDELEKMAKGEVIVHIVVKDKNFEQVLKASGIDIVEVKERDNEVEFIVTHDEKGDLRERIFNIASENKTVLLEMWRERVSLEDIFLKLTKEDVA